MTLNRTLNIFTAAALAAGFMASPAAVSPKALAQDAPTAQPPQTAQPAQPAQITYKISGFDLRYLAPHPRLPKLSQLANTQVTLGVNANGYVAPDQGQIKQTKPIDKLCPAWAVSFTPQAVQAVLVQLRNALTAQHLIAVFVAPDPADIGPRGKDLRSPGDTVLHIIITVGRVSQVRTVASGEGSNPNHRIDNPKQAWIIKQSPIQAPHGNVPGSLLHQETLNDYVDLLNRQPGRSVGVALSPSQQTAGVNLDYLITENKPWTVYAQLSNTGTKETHKLREQFGFYDTQLTGHDDVFSGNYVTSSFDETQAAELRYEAPFGDHNQRLRWAAHARWGQYTASDVGFANEQFTGKSWDGGAQLIANIYQHRNFFLDALIGARFEWMRVNNTLPGTSPGQERFVLPHIGLQAAMDKEWYHLHANALFEFTNGNWTGATQDEVNNLGRTGVDKSWSDLRWNVNYSVFLEPLLDYADWSNPSAPGSHTLAHEVSISFAGQYALNNRLIPQEEDIAGGMYTVRGYPQSVVAGDDVEIVRVAYKFHLPRVFRVQPQAGQMLGQPFRFAPQYVYGLPDWDFAPKVFFDLGHVASNASNGAAAEPSATLTSAGVGFDAVVKRNLRLELDWGFALRPVQNVSYGSNQLYFAVTALY